MCTNTIDQGMILQQTAENTLAYSLLATQRSQIAPLSLECAKIMWSLVDYSTISNEEKPASWPDNTSPSADLWFESWIDLFGMQNHSGDFGMDRNVLDNLNGSLGGDVTGV